MTSVISDPAVSQGDVLRRIADAEGDVAHVRTARRGEHTSIGRRGIRLIDEGSLTVEGGSVRLRSTDGVNVVYVGDVFAGQDTSRGWIFRFDTGNQAFSLQGAEGHQTWILWDSSRNSIVSSDANSGFGLARPYLPYPAPTALGVGHWPGTEESSFSAIARSVVNVQHSRIRVDLRAWAPSDTAGQVRMTVTDDNIQIGPTIDVSAGFEGEVFTVEFPNIEAALGNWRSITVQARRTSGSGEVRARVASVYGVRS